jgi:2-polyprenyl-3-methyl-5-hydroxy-6-metoxy-1,4-benzoquinol methylase
MSRTCLACKSTEAKHWGTATDFEYYSTDENYDFYKCENCASVFIDPVPESQLSQIYPNNYYSFKPHNESFVQKIKKSLDQKFFSKLFKRIPGEKLAVLDIGGGSGWLLDLVKGIDHRIDYTCVVDFDEKAEAEARANGHDYFNGRIEDYQTDKKYDFILLLNLIEHVADPKAVMAKVQDLLSDQGMAVIKTPNVDSLDAKLFKNKYWGGYHCPRHWTLFTRESFASMIADLNLKEESFSYTQGAPFWTFTSLFYLKKWGLISISKERPAVYHPLNGVLNGLWAAFDILRSPFGKTSQMFITLKKKA